MRPASLALDTDKRNAHDAAPLTAAMPSLSPRLSRENLRLRLYLLSLCLDLAFLLISFALANLLVIGSLFGQPGKPHGFVMFAMIAPVFALLSINGGAYGLRMIHESRQATVRSIWALVQAAFLMLLIVYFGKMAERLSRLTLLTGLVLSTGGLAVARQMTGRIAEHWLGDFPTLDLVLTDGIDYQSSRAFHVVDAATAGIDPERFDADMAARLSALAGFAERIVVACPADRMELWSLALKTLGAKGEILVPEMMRFAPAKVAEFDHHPTVIVAGGPLQFRDRIAKRIADLAIGGLATLLLSPVFLATAVAVKLSSPGPVLFRQQRIGKDGRPFAIYKFRTMRAELTDHKAEQLTRKDDHRVTPVGNFLRRTSLDELPQLLNVLKGDMSLVGPRPHAPAARAADQLYWEVDPRYWARHCIKPGMTGLAQIRGYRGATVEREDLVNRLQSDLEYVTDWSLWRDLKIILATLRVMVHHNAF